MDRKELESESIGTWDGDIAEYTDYHQYYPKEEADAVMDAMEAKIKELEERIAHTNYINKTLGEGLKDREARIKELEKEVDSVKMNSGYVAFMEAQARIKELEADSAKKLRQIENGMKGARILEGRIKELEELIEAYKEAERNNI